MHKLTASLLLSLAALCGQTADAPTWKEYSLGRPTKGPGRFSRDGIQGTSVPLKRILARAYGVPEHRVVGPEWISGETYALTALVSNPADFQPLMQRELAASFFLTAHRESRIIPVLVLKPLNGSQPLETQAPADKLASSIHLMRSSMGDFASTLSDAISRPVIDETQIDGHYEIYFSWDRKNAAAIPAAIKQQLGVDVVEENRPVDLVVIDHIERPKFN